MRMSNDYTTTEGAELQPSPQRVQSDPVWVDRIISGLSAIAESTHGIDNLLVVLRDYIGSSRERARWVQEQFWHPNDAQQLRENLINAPGLAAYQETLADPNRIPLQSYEAALQVARDTR
jgi:hypothetical protein